MWHRRAKRPAATSAMAFMAFRQCPLCNYDLATGEGERGCHYYDCPYLPEELDVRCPICLYNFYIDDGNPDCSDPPACQFAREVAPQRVANLDAWLREHERIPPVARQAQRR